MRPNGARQSRRATRPRRRAGASGLVDRLRDLLAPDRLARIPLGGPRPGVRPLPGQTASSCRPGSGLSGTPGHLAVRGAAHRARVRLAAGGRVAPPLTAVGPCWTRVGVGCCSRPGHRSWRSPRKILDHTVQQVDQTTGRPPMPMPMPDPSGGGPASAPMSHRLPPRRPGSPATFACCSPVVTVPHLDGDGLGWSRGTGGARPGDAVARAAVGAAGALRAARRLPELARNRRARAGGCGGFGGVSGGR